MKNNVDSLPTLNKEGVTPSDTKPMKHEYSKWRHGGWYVSTVRYKNGACGCVSRNFPDKKWRIVCDPRRKTFASHVEGDFTFHSRDAAADAEFLLAQGA